MTLMIGLPPELAPYTHDLATFERATGFTLHFPPLGTGGGGTVLKATTPEGAEVAIKVVVAEDAARHEQVRREAAILTQVQHAGALCGAGLLWEQHYPQVDICFLAMEYIAGRTLGPAHRGTTGRATRAARGDSPGRSARGSASAADHSPRCQTGECLAPAAGHALSPHPRRLWDCEAGPPHGARRQSGDRWVCPARAVQRRHRPTHRWLRAGGDPL